MKFWYVLSKEIQWIGDEERNDEIIEVSKARLMDIG